MSNGGAQHHVFGPYWDSANSTMYEDIYVYAFDAGAYTVAKDFWNAEDKTGGAVQSKQGGSHGTVSGYFDGDYNFRIKASDDSTVIISYDSKKITSGTNGLWEGAYGTGDPAVSDTNKNQYNTKYDASDNLLKFRINNGKDPGAAWHDIAEFDASGNQLFDSVITATMPVYNVKHSDYGAAGDGVTVDTSAIQTAITAIPATGGVLYFPQGVYIVGSLNITNKAITIVGDGQGVSILRRNAVNANPILNHSTTNVIHNFAIRDISVETTIASNSTGISCTWPTSSTDFDYSNFQICNVAITPNKSDKATAYFDTCLEIAHGKKGYIHNLYARAHDNNVASTIGLSFTGTTFNTMISKSRIWYHGDGIVFADDCQDIKIEGNEINRCNTGISLGLNVSSNNWFISDNQMHNMEEFGITTTSNVVGSVIITGNTIKKLATSTQDFRGVDGDYDNYIIANNVVQDNGSASGTDIGCLLDTSTDGLVTNNIFIDLDTGVQLTSNSGTNQVYDNRGSGLTNIVVNQGGTNVIYDNYPPAASVPAFTDGDTTPSVLNSQGGNGQFLTANTGATSITDFDDAYLGQIIYVRAGDANTTLVHALGVLHLQGSINYAMASGDRITLLQDNLGVWTEYSRTTA